MECPLCIEVVKDKNIFTCFNCKYKNCIDCHKNYLLNSNNDTFHCLNCKTVSSYLFFIENYNKNNWISKIYKPLKEKILENKELELLKNTLNDLIKEKKIKNLKTEKDSIIKSRINLKKKIETHKEYLKNLTVPNFFITPTDI